VYIQLLSFAPLSLSLSQPRVSKIRPAAILRYWYILLPVQTFNVARIALSVYCWGWGWTTRIRFPAETIFLFYHRVQTSWGPPSFLFNGLWGLFPSW
jgi:hypothetical protein